MAIDIRCGNCGSLFGKEEGPGVLVIKSRDLIRTVEGRASGPCRKCKAIVSWPAEGAK